MFIPIFPSAGLGAGHVIVAKQSARRVLVTQRHNLLPYWGR